jgi:hypothetical protein
MEEIRPLEEQFEERTVQRVRALQADLMASRYDSGPGGFYIKELSRSLETGLLLASLHLATSFLESFVRDLLMYTLVDGLSSGASRVELAKLEKRLEDSTDPQWSFARIVSELQKSGVVDSSDGEAIKNYYKVVRIPIHHGLIRRFVRSHGERKEDIDSVDVFDMLFGRVKWHSFEQRLEEEGLDLIETAVAFVRKYSDKVAA